MKSQLSKGVNSSYIACLVIFLICSFSLPIAFAESMMDGKAKLIEGAKKEGNLLWYYSMGVQEANTYIKGFEAKYPFVKVDQFRGLSHVLLNKVTTEAKMGRLLFDLIATTDAGLMTYAKLGLTVPYHSTERKFYTNEHKDKEGYWTGIDFQEHIIAYNTKMVKPADVPKKYEDLLDPKWKGKMGVEWGTEQGWFAAILEIMGQERGLDFFRRLGKQQLNIRTGHTLLVQLCAAGEFPVVVSAYATGVEQMKAMGAPVNWVPVNPVVIYSNGISLGKYAPHPNAAKLFIDFILSREGQEIVRDNRRVPSRTGVLPNPPELVKGLTFYPKPNEYINENYRKIDKQYKDLISGK